MTELTANRDTVMNLIKTHNTHDSVVIRRCMDILDLCSNGDKTVQELADHFEMNYQTIYLNVRLLETLGVLEVSPARLGKRNLYRTNWDFVANEGAELKWRDNLGNFVPISEYIEKFHKVAPDFVSAHLKQFALAMISYKENAQRLAREQPNYGVEHQAACRRRMALSVEAVENILNVMHQAMDSPAFTKEDGWEMYKLPTYISEEDASSIHDEMEMDFQERGWYEGK